MTTSAADGGDRQALSSNSEDEQEDDVDDVALDGGSDSDSEHTLERPESPDRTLVFQDEDTRVSRLSACEAFQTHMKGQAALSFASAYQNSGTQQLLG